VSIYVSNKRNDIAFIERKKERKQYGERVTDGKIKKEKRSSHCRSIKGKNKISKLFSEVIFKWQISYKFYLEPYFLCTSSKINKTY